MTKENVNQANITYTYSFEEEGTKFKAVHKKLLVDVTVFAQLAFTEQSFSLCVWQNICKTPGERVTKQAQRAQLNLNTL